MGRSAFVQNCMNAQARTFHEDNLKRKAQSLQLAYTRALNSHDGSTPLYLHQEMDFLGHFEPDTQVSLAMGARGHAARPCGRHHVDDSPTEYTANQRLGHSL